MKYKVKRVEKLKDKVMENTGCLESHAIEINRHAETIQVILTNLDELKIFGEKQAKRADENHKSYWWSSTRERKRPRPKRK